MARIHCIFEDTPFFMPDYVRAFLTRRRAEIVSLTASNTERARPASARSGTTFFSYAYRHPLRFGLRALAVLGTRTIFYAAANIGAHAAGAVSRYCVRDIGKFLGIPLIDTVSINDTAYLAKVAQMKPDIIVSTQGQIFRADILSLPRIACLNVHTSILPSNGGCYPALYALINGDSHYGVSCHVMEEGIDRGLVTAQRRFPVEPDDTVFSLYAKAYGVAAEVLDEGIANLLAGGGYPDTSDVTPSYFSFPDSSHFEQLFASGRRFI